MLQSGSVPARVADENSPATFPDALKAKIVVNPAVRQHCHLREWRLVKIGTGHWLDGVLSESKSDW